MKAALLKEFYLWKATCFKFLLIVIFFTVFSVVSKSTTLTIFPLFMMISSAAACFSEDKKTAWADYSRCLPNTAAQRVTAKYIFALSEVMTGVLLSLVTALQASYHAGVKLNTIDVYYGRTFANHLIYTVLLAVGFSVLVPLSYKLKPKKGEKINYVLFAVYFLGIAVAGGFVALTSAFSFLNFGFNLADVLCEKILLDVVLAVIVVASVISSWFVCVWLESINCTCARKKLQIKAVVFACIAAIALCVAAGVVIWDVNDMGGLINEGNLFGGNEENEYSGAERIEVYNSDEDESRAKMFEYIDTFCADGYNNEMSLSDFENRLKAFGAVKREDSIGIFYTPDQTLSVNARDELGTDKIVKITVTANPEPTEIKKATDASFKAYTEQFYEGMTESELIARFRELGLCPISLTEEPQSMKRKYNVEFHIKKFNYDKSADAGITVYTQNSVVSMVEYYVI